MKGQEGKKGLGVGKKPVFQWNVQQNVLMHLAVLEVRRG